MSNLETMKALRKQFEPYVKCMGEVFVHSTRLDEYVVAVNFQASSYEAAVFIYNYIRKELVYNGFVVTRVFEDPDDLIYEVTAPITQSEYKRYRKCLTPTKS